MLSTQILNSNFTPLYASDDVELLEGSTFSQTPINIETWHSRRSVSKLESCFVPVRTHSLSTFCKDFFLPLSTNRFSEISENICNPQNKCGKVTLKGLLRVGLLSADILSLGVRVITVIPRAIYNCKHNKESHPLTQFLITHGKEVDSIPDQVIVRKSYAGYHPLVMRLNLVETPKQLIDFDVDSEINPHFQERKIPPLSFRDTIRQDSTGKIVSAHGSGEIFSLNEIIEIEPIVEKVSIAEDIFAWKTRHGKWIIQQQATRGCTAAVTAMLIKDHGKEINIEELCNRNLGNDEDKKRDLIAAGLRPIQEQIFSLGGMNDLISLRDMLIRKGSAIVSIIDPECGGHCVVVDHISEKSDKVRLRDPYHGWEITVTATAFLKRNPNCSKVIQIESSQL